MIRRAALIAALAAAAVDLLGALARVRYGWTTITPVRAALMTAAALVPCGLAFAATIFRQVKAGRPHRRRALATMRLPLVVPRAYVGAAVLGFIGTLAAMGERFAPYVFLAGIALTALALSQARPRHATVWR